MTYRKKLIEVALPLEAINVASAREKSIRHGHPSTLHLWWARRPLAACRAVLFASLVDDPDSDPSFQRSDGTVDEERAGVRRAELFNLIEDLVKWENSNNESVLNRARAEIAASVASRKVHDTKEWPRDKVICGEKAWAFVCRTAKPQNVNAFLVEHAPPVLDPFCGGGSIPLEAQRLGLRAYGSDLNPVAVLITKALIEIPPKFAGMPPVNPKANAKLEGGWKGAQGLAEDVRYYGKWMRDEAERRTGHLYPKIKVTAEMATDRLEIKPYIGQELTVIGWLWARTSKCTNPACGQSVPLVSDPGLCKRSSRPVSLAHAKPIKPGAAASWFVVSAKVDAANSTIGRAGAVCPSCGAPIPLDEIRTAGQSRTMGRQLMAVIAAGHRERVYLPASAAPDAHDLPMTPPDLLNSHLPEKALGFRVQNYGLRQHRDLFTNRQLLLLDTLCDLVRDTHALAQQHGADEEYAKSIMVYLALGIGRIANRHSSQSFWNANRETVEQVFARNALPMIWVYAEGNPFSESSGNINGQFEYLYNALAAVPARSSGVVEQCDARTSWLKEPHTVSTDPPYYDNVPYADLSDFFYVWHRRALLPYFPQLYATVLTPKSMELIAEPARHKDASAAKQFFEDGLRSVFEGIRARTESCIPITVYYAFKQSEEEEESHASSGWDTILQGIVDSGWSVTGTWPMRTEQPGGLREHGRNSLASSIVLVCRERSPQAPLATRREFLNAMKGELPTALKNLQRGNVAPVDFAQASIGPGMAVFTRYSKVMEADGGPMKVRQALALINQTLDEVLAEQEGDFDPDTRWAVAWFEQFGMEDGPFGTAETLSRAKNTAVNALVEAGIIRAGRGKVRLLKRAELPPDWDPATDNRVPAWEATQYLIQALETGGETAAAALLRKLGGFGETVRDLAYRLFHTCERKGWAGEALAYNGLVVAWPEVSRLARVTPSTEPVPQQTKMF